MTIQHLGIKSSRYKQKIIAYINAIHQHPAIRYSLLLPHIHYDPVIDPWSWIITSPERHKKFCLLTLQQPNFVHTSIHLHRGPFLLTYHGHITNTECFTTAKLSLDYHVITESDQEIKICNSIFICSI
jgi:hypothetical protein